jgi:hypothetical protein
MWNENKVMNSQIKDSCQIRLAKYGRGMLAGVGCAGVNNALAGVIITGHQVIAGLNSFSYATYYKGAFIPSTPTDLTLTAFRSGGGFPAYMVGNFSLSDYFTSIGGANFTTVPGTVDGSAVFGAISTGGVSFSSGLYASGAYYDGWVEFQNNSGSGANNGEWFWDKFQFGNNGYATLLESEYTSSDTPVSLSAAPEATPMELLALGAAGIALLRARRTGKTRV